jgi:hypothetical protein
MSTGDNLPASISKQEPEARAKRHIPKKMPRNATVESGVDRNAENEQKAAAGMVVFSQ